MPTFLVNQTKSYTLAVNAETGELHVELSDELKENLKEQASDAETNADMFGLTLDLMGKDSPEYLAAMDELMGTSGTLADAYIQGGTEAVIAAVAEIKGDAFADANGFMERAKSNDAFDHFAEIPGSDLSDIMGYGQPAGDPFAEEGSEEGKDAIEDLWASEQGQISAWWVAPAVLIVVGAAAVVIDTVTAEPAAKVNNKDKGGFLGEVKFGDDDEQMPADPDEQMPADPDDPGFNFEEWLERPWAEETLDPTFGETMPGDPSSDPNEGIQKEEYTKEFDPEAELDGVILWDKDHVEDAITAAEAQEAAEFAIVSTTLPVEPEFQFKTEFGGEVPGQGGEDFNEDPAMATATEYIVGKMEGGLYVEDTMMFKENVQTGVVETEGTSGGVLEGQLNEAETGVHVHVEML